MSIALERNNTDPVVATSSYNQDHDTRIRRPGFGGSKMTCISIYGTDNGSSSPEFGVVDCSEVVEDESTSSTSSIGKNSDEESSPGRCSDGGDDEEVQSDYKGGALGNLEELEEVLPMKRSISHFYSGKSKSFTSLGDAVTCSSIKDIVKPENAYSRRRKNLLAYRNIWDKNRNGIRRSNSGGILKRHSNSRSNLALAATMGCAESSNGSDNSNLNLPSIGSCLPPLPPQVRRFACNDLSSPPLQQKLSSLRSFSLSDLQGVAAIQSISGHDDR